MRHPTVLAAAILALHEQAAPVGWLPSLRPDWAPLDDADDGEPPVGAPPAPPPGPSLHPPSDGARADWRQSGGGTDTSCGRNSG